MPAIKKPEGKRDYFEIKAIDESSAAIYLFEAVGDWDSDAAYFKYALDILGEVSNIDLHINSPGGSVFEGIAIFNLLKNHSAQITVYIDGLAASMASYIAMVGDLVVMPENAMMMIHNPNMVAIGEEKDMDKAKEVLSTAKKAMLGAYIAKSRKTEQEIIDIMDAETWLSGADAVEMGFADVLEKPVEMAACSKFDLNAFKNAPDFLKPSASAGTTTQKEAIMPQATQKPAAENNPVDIQAVQAQALEAEKQRRDGIKKVFGAFKGDHSDLLEACLDDMGTTVADAQAKLLNTLGNQSADPVAASRLEMGASAETKMLEGFSSSLMARAGLANDNKSNQYRGFSMIEMARRTLEMRGVNTVAMDKMALVAAAFTHGASDFGNLLSGTANKAMLKGYEEAQEVFTKFCSVGNLPDFKVSERTDIGTFPSLRKVRPGAEYKTVTTDDRKATLQLATYGEKFGITRQAIINDDLNAFSRIPRKFGGSAKRTVGDLVFGILTGNPKMADGTVLFHSNHKNLGSAVLGSAGLSAGKKAMRTQKDGIAVLNIRPEFLIVPVGLEDTAKTLISSEYEVVDAKNGTTPNPHRNMAEVISDARLDDVSATAWYLLAGLMHDTIEVSYLDGNDQPVLEQQAGWDVDGVEFKVRLDAGVDALEYRTQYKSTGA